MIKKNSCETVLLIKTSTDERMEKAVRWIGGEECQIYCLTQISQLERLQEKFPDVTFINCEKNSFYDLSDDVIGRLKEHFYHKIVVLTTTPRAHNFGNIIEIVRLLKFDKLIFFHTENQIQETKRMRKAEAILYKGIIKFYELIYR